MSGKRLDHLIDALPDPVFAIDASGILVEWNEAVGKVTGYSDDEIADMTVAAFFPAEEQTRVLTAVEVAFEHGHSELETRVLTTMGDEIPFAFRCSRTTDASGETVLVGSGRDLTERQQAEQRTEESERRLQQITENLDATAWLATLEKDPANSEILYLSPGFEETFGISEEEIRANPMAFLDLVQPEDTEDVLEAMISAEGEDRSFEVEYRVRLGDGTVKHLRTRGIPIHDEAGEPYRLAGVTEDVTREVEHRRAIARERDHQAALFEQNTDAILEFGFDEEGRSFIRAVNDSFEDVFGFDEGEILGRRIADALVPEEGIEKHEEFNRRVLSGEPVEGEVERMTVDGLRTFRLQATPVDVEGVDLGGYAWYTDLTELRRLQEEEALKARMLDQVGQAVIATDPDGTVTYWNKHAEELYGYPREEAIGRPILDLTVPDKDEVREDVAQLMARMREGEPWTDEFTVQHADGSTFTALVSDAPVFDDEGELIGVIGVSQDISDLKQRERDLVRLTNQLRARNRELRELSQAAAHDFRTPIWDTVRYLDLLEATAGDVLAGQAQEHLETARAGAHRLHDLVESLQEYLDASTRDPGGGPTDAGEVLDEVLATLSDEIEASGTQVHVEEPAPELAVDAPELADVFRHLLANAITFSDDEPPTIEVAFEREDEMWVVSVSDDGCGIAPEYQERVFRPFRTLHGPEEGGGAGLGLALCRGFVEVHGGVIWVTSTPGEGTTVNMTLPAAGHEIPEALEALREGEGFDEDPELFG